MAITNGYCDLAELRMWLNSDSQTQLPSTMDQTVERIVESASRWIDAYCGTSFFAVGSTGTPVFREFEADSPWCVKLNGFNRLTHLSTFATDDAFDGSFATAWNVTTDVQLWPPAAFGTPEPAPFTEIRTVGTKTIPRPPSFASRRNVVRISGVFGWPTVPTAVRQACIMRSAGILDRRNSPGGVMGVNDFGLVRVGAQVDAEVRELLSEYRITSHGFA